MDHDIQLQEEKNANKKYNIFLSNFVFKKIIYSKFKLKYNLNSIISY